MDLRELTQEFFKILDYTEESESGIEFNPVSISCCRALLVKPLSKIITQMRELSGE